METMNPQLARAIILLTIRYFPGILMDKMRRAFRL